MVWGRSYGSKKKKKKKGGEKKNFFFFFLMVYKSLGPAPFHAHKEKYPIFEVTIRMEENSFQKEGFGRQFLVWLTDIVEC